MCAVLFAEGCGLCCLTLLSVARDVVSGRQRSHLRLSNYLN